MKKNILFLSLLLSACATTKSLPDNRLVLAEHKAPLKIFSIGHYNSNSLILTLIDAENTYFMIEAPIDTSLRIGKTYP